MMQEFPAAGLLTCPICHLPLRQEGHTLICINRHSFDLAREGYVHLLRKAQQGDTKEMLAARRTFFEHGYYRPLSDAINALIVEQLPNVPVLADRLAILDAGCGEGYYLGRLQAALSDQGQATTCLGLDISKEAIRMAARRYKNASFVVANLKERLVIADNALHTILNIFAPHNFSEFARVLAPGGLLLIVIPSPTHLLQLRNALNLLTIEENKQENILAQCETHFAVHTINSLQYEIVLQASEIPAAVMMTPNYWHMTDTMREKMGSMQELHTAVAFTHLLLRRI